MGWPQTHDTEEARQLARDFCQDALSEHFLGTLKRKRTEKLKGESDKYIYTRFRKRATRLNQISEVGIRDEPWINLPNV